MKDDLLIGRGSGVINTSDTSPVTGVEVYAIEIMVPTVFNSVTERNATGTFTTEELLPPRVILGDFTGYQLASGAVRAYRR